jgi:hypothetical protein
MVTTGTGAFLANLIIPPHVTEMHIWADNDKSGLESAGKLANRYQNIDVIIHVPRRDLEPRKGNPDWNDLLIKDDGDSIRDNFKINI